MRKRLEMWAINSEEYFPHLPTKRFDCKNYPVEGQQLQQKKVRKEEKLEKGKNKKGKSKEVC